MQHRTHTPAYPWPETRCYLYPCHSLLNEDDLDVWLWYRGIIPKTHDGLFERIIWHDIFLTLGRFVTLMGNHERPTPLLAQLRDCPMGRRWAWPDDTTPDVVYSNPAVLTGDPRISPYSPSTHHLSIRHVCAFPPRPPDTGPSSY